MAVLVLREGSAFTGDAATPLMQAISDPDGVLFGRRCVRDPEVLS